MFVRDETRPLTSQLFLGPGSTFQGHRHLVLPVVWMSHGAHQHKEGRPMSVSLSRRAFLAGAASLAGVGSVCALAPRAAAAMLASAGVRKLALRRSAFLPLVGQSFRIVHDRESLTVILRQVSDLKPTVRPGAEDQFSLIFTGAGFRPALPQGTYAISHARRGRISLFVVPVGPRRVAQQYQVIIDSRPLAAIH